MEKKDYKKAIDCFKDALHINPRFSSSWKAIGHIYYENNSASTAAKYYEKAL